MRGFEHILDELLGSVVQLGFEHDGDLWLARPRRRIHPSSVGCCHGERHSLGAVPAQLSWALQTPSRKQTLPMELGLRTVADQSPASRLALPTPAPSLASR